MMEDQELKSLKIFLEHLGQYGKHRKVVRLYGKETQPSDIIVGEIQSISNTAEKPNRTLLVTVLREVYPDGSKGKLFSLFAFDKYAHILKSSNSVTGSIIGICGADIDKSPVSDDNDHDRLPYRARLGLPKKNGSKFIFMTNSQSKENETLPKMERLNKPKQTLTSSQTKQCVSKSLEITSKEELSTSITTGRASNSKPEKNASRTGPKTSKVLENVSCNVLSPSKALSSKSNMPHSISSATPSTSTPRKDISEGSQNLRATETVNRYRYSKLCDLTAESARLNVYGVISRLLRERNNYAHLDLVDETLPGGETFKLHIFKGPAPSLPRITEGYIIRTHRMKTEEYQGQWDGRVFNARDVVIFPPEGNGKEGAEAVSKNFYFDDADAKRLTELRQWIKEEYSRKPSSPIPTSREGNAYGEERNNTAGYNSNVKTLAEIQSEGHYILYCKVVESNQEQGKTALIVTDGTIPSDLLMRDETYSADPRVRSSKDLRTVKVILKPETHIRFQNQFVKMIGVQAEMILDPCFGKTCLAFVLQKVQNIRVIPPTHSQAKLISRRLQQLEKDAHCPASAVATGISKTLPDGQEVENDSNSKSGRDVCGSGGVLQNRKKITKYSRSKSECRELERSSEGTQRAAESTDVQQRQRPSSSIDFLQTKHHHSYDSQRQFDVTPLETEDFRDNRNEIQVSDFNTSTPVKNSDVPDNNEEDGKHEDIISLLYSLPKKGNVPEHVNCTRNSVLLTEEKQRSSKVCEKSRSSKQKAPLVPRANSKDGSELLKSLKQQARKRVYGNDNINLNHSDCSNNTIYDDGVQTVPNQMPDEKFQSQDCLECNDLDSAETMANLHHCLSRIARVEPVTRDQEISEVKIYSDVECTEAVEQFRNSEGQSPTETEYENTQQSFDVIDLSDNDSEQGDNRSDGESTVIVDNSVRPVAGPSTYKGSLRERIPQSQASNDNIVSGSSDDDSETSSACTNITQKKSILGKRVAESDADRQCKYPKTSSANSVRDVQIANSVRDVQNADDSDYQDSIISESSTSAASHWTEIQDSAEENPIPVTIRCIKSRGIEENEYLVEGVITHIEPSIRANSRDFVSGYCSSCNKFSRYSSLIVERSSQERTCPHCPEGRRKLVSLVFALKFHIVDKTNEELVVGLCGESGVDFFGVTVNRYLRDLQIRKQVADALQDLLASNKVKRESRKIRLCIQSFLDLSGMQYMIKKTYLCFTHGRI